MKKVSTFMMIILVCACGGGGGGGGSNPVIVVPPPTPNALFQDVSATNLTASETSGACMDAEHGDYDGDGDPDLALAQEFSTNKILLNNGSGVFSEKANAIPGASGDNEDLRMRDFDGDGDADMVTVHEDDREHGLFLNDGAANFTDVSSRIPVESTANAVEVLDVNNDGRPDILIGNEGKNLVLVQQANGTFVDDTNNRPIGLSVTQDILLFDMDGDSDLDLLSLNESPNQLFVNDGANNFTDETAQRLPAGDDESRQADAADIDNDGDLDLIVGNIQFQTSFPIENKILINDGTGVFTDETAARLSGISNLGSSFTVHFFDLDSDGDQDIFSPVTSLGGGGTMDVWLNDGSGMFSRSTSGVFSTTIDGSVFDIEIFDANGDGMLDLYICHRSGADQLFIRQ